MADLGQNTSTILTKATTLAYYTQQFQAIARLAGPNAPPGPATNSYVEISASQGPLQTSPVIISSKYLCQVPQRKAIGSLLMTILLANLVSMETAWSITNFCAGIHAQRCDPSGKYQSHVNLNKAHADSRTGISKFLPGVYKQRVFYRRPGSRKEYQHRPRTTDRFSCDYKVF